MIQILFGTPTIRRRHNPESASKIRSIYRTNPQSVRFLRPNPSIRKPIQPPHLTILLSSNTVSSVRLNELLERESYFHIFETRESEIFISVIRYSLFFVFVNRVRDNHPRPLPPLPRSPVYDPLNKYRENVTYKQPNNTITAMFIPVCSKEGILVWLCFR